MSSHALLVVLTGASGSGKTTLVRALQASGKTRCRCLFFDSIGVPSIEEMEREFGHSGDAGGGWQRAMTLQWMERIAPIVKAEEKTSEAVLFEGQMRITFIEEAIRAAGITRSRIVLVDCDDATRASRLTHDRRQPELANDTMLNWAAFLRREAESHGCEILDTSSISIGEGAQRLSEMFARS